MIYRLDNPIRSYAWGSTTVIPELLGIPHGKQPQAELWLGAHPDSPSLLADGTGLDVAIASNARELLGDEAQEVHGPRLPFLMKVLAAAAPLSLQVHPDDGQAASGFADEEVRGVDPASPQRRYRDPYSKPEMVVALSRFEALCGLRAPSQTLAILAPLDVNHSGWRHLLRLLSAAEAQDSLLETVNWLLSGEDLAPLVSAVCNAAGQVDSAVFDTVRLLAQTYPDDRGILIALLLNRVTLSPGEALFVSPMTLHTYLGGSAIEIMSTSDNVLRAGLTSKHVDAAQVLHIADFSPAAPSFIEPTRAGPTSTFSPVNAPFTLLRLQLDVAAAQWQRLDLAGPRILLVLEGDIEVDALGGVHGKSQKTQRFSRGESAFVAAGATAVRLRGQGHVVVAGLSDWM